MQPTHTALMHISPEQREVAYNPKYEELYAPEVS